MGTTDQVKELTLVIWLFHPLVWPAKVLESVREANT